MKTFFSVILFASFIYSNCFSQAGISAVPFLQIHQSAEVFGLGGAGVALHSDDPLTVLSNPAILAPFTDMLSFQASSNHSDWLPELSDDLFYTSYGLSTGINLEKLISFPIRTQLTFSRIHLDLGENVRTSPEGEELARFSSEEYSNAVTFGVSAKWYAEWSAGITYHSIYSQIGSFTTDGKTYEKNFSKPNATSYGMKISLPVHEFFADSKSQNFYGQYYINLGASLLNDGDFVKYKETDKADPLPKMANIGYATNFRYNYRNDDIDINLVDFQWSVQVSDLLVKTIDSTQNGYRNFPGSIDLWNHVVRLQADPGIGMHQGVSVGFLETIRFIKGTRDETGFNEQIKSDGFEVKTTGFFKWLSSGIQEPLIKQLLSSSSVSYTRSSYHLKDFNHPLYGTTMEGFRLQTSFQL